MHMGTVYNLIIIIVIGDHVPRKVIYLVISVITWWRSINVR